MNCHEAAAFSLASRGAGRRSGCSVRTSRGPTGKARYFPLEDTHIHTESCCVCCLCCVQNNTLSSSPSSSKSAILAQRTVNKGNTRVARYVAGSPSITNAQQWWRAGQGGGTHSLKTPICWKNEASWSMRLIIGEYWMHGLLFKQIIPVAHCFYATFKSNKQKMAEVKIQPGNPSVSNSSWYGWHTRYCHYF